MSGFFKRFKGGNNESNNRELKNDTKKEKTTSESCHISEDDGLSLFSGMTFNPASNYNSQPCPKTASQDLTESGLNLNTTSNNHQPSPKTALQDLAESGLDLNTTHGHQLGSSKTASQDLAESGLNLNTTSDNPQPILKTASQDLTESGLNLTYKQPPVQEIHKEESKLSSEKITDETVIGEDGGEQVATPLPSSTAMQQFKKKKKTQAKRPGYARDSSMRKSDKKNTTHKKDDNAIKEISDTAKKIDHQPFDKPAREQEKYDIGGDSHGDVSNADDNNDDKDDGNDGDKGAGNSINTSIEKNRDITIYDSSVQSSNDKNGDVTSAVDVDYIGHDNFEVKEDNNPAKETTAVHHLYSIGTPSSSEEDLCPDSERQDETDIGYEEANTNICTEQEDSEAKSHDNKKTNELTDTTPKDTLNSKLKDIHPDIKTEENSTVINASDAGDIEENRTCGRQVLQSEQGHEIKVDAEDKLVMMQQDMQFRISALKEKEESLASLKNYLIDNYTNTDAVYAIKQQELNNLMQEEANAIANDNYDLAEELAVKIDQMKDDLETTKYKVPTLDVKVHQAIQLAADITSKSLAIHREAQTSLQEFKEESVTQLDSNKHEITTRLSKEKQQLNLEKQRIDRTRAHLELDSEHLTKEQTILEKEIVARSEVFVTHKTELVEKHQHVKQEIAELEEKLIQLRINQAQIEDEISTEECKLEEVLKEFSPQKDALDIQRKELENQQRLLDEQQESLTSSLAIFDTSVEEWNNKESRLSGFVGSLEAAIESNNSVINQLENERKHFEEFQCIKHFSLPSDHELENLKSSAKRSHQQIKTLKTKINLSNLTMASLKKRLSEIEDQISERNEAKDIAKKERNFKEAKRLKEEVENLNAKGKDNQTKLECIIEEQNKDSVELENAEKDFEIISGELKKKVFESDVKVVNTAAQVVQDLNHHIHRYKDNDLLHTLITAELQTCQNLIKELCKKHSLDVPLNTENPPPDTDDSHKHMQDSVDDNNSLQVELDELEIKLETVVELEDFDEAERIQQQINEIKSRLK